MAGSDTDTVELDFGGNFAEGANESIAAADALAASYVKLGDAAERVKDPKFVEAEKVNAITRDMERQASLAAQIATFDANRVRALAAQEAQLKKMKDDALGKRPQESSSTKDLASLQDLQGIKSLLGGNLTGAAEQMLGSATALGASAGVVGAVASKIIEGAEKLIGAAYSLGESFAKISIEETSKRQVQSAIGGRLGGDYEQTVKMALKMGIDPEQAWQETKKLLSDRFSKNEIPAILRIKTGMDEAGQNGQGLIAELQRLKLEPKVNDGDIKKLVRSGIDSKQVYAELAKELGTNVAGAMAKVKAGTADTEKVIQAIEKVAGDKFGGIADTIGDSMPALLARLKGDAAHLFDDMDLSGPKEFIKMLAGVLEGPAGAALKGGLKDLFSAGADLLKGVSAKDLAMDLGLAADFLHEIAADLRNLGPGIKAIAGFAGDELTGGLILAKGVVEAIDMHLRAIGALLNGDIKGAFNEIFGPHNQAAPGPPASPEEQKYKAGRIAGADEFDQAAPAFDAGQNMSLGMADGIRAGESEAIEASAQMAEKSLQAAKDRLAIHSPSGAFEDEVGGPSAQGMAKGMADHPGPANAAAQMAKGALGAANDNAGGLGAIGGGSGGGNVYNFSPQIVLPPGSSAATQAAAQAGVAAAYPEFLAMVRRAGRDR